MALQRRLAEHERIEGAAQDRDDGDLARLQEVVQPHQRQLDGMLAAVVILLGKGLLLADFGGEGVDDVLVRGQRPERRGVALAGEGEPAGAAGVVGAEDHGDLGLGDGSGGPGPDLGVSPPAAVVVDVGGNDAEATPVQEAHFRGLHACIGEILGEGLLQLDRVGGVDAACVAQRPVGKLTEVVDGLVARLAEAFVVKQEALAERVDDLGDPVAAKVDARAKVKGRGDAVHVAVAVAQGEQRPQRFWDHRVAQQIVALAVLLDAVDLERAQLGTNGGRIVLHRVRVGPGTL